MPTLLRSPRPEARLYAVGDEPAIEELARGVVREIRLEPVRDTVIAARGRPEVHHLR